MPPFSPAAWWRLPSYDHFLTVLSILDPSETATFAARIITSVGDRAGHVRIDRKRPVTAGRITGEGVKLILVGALGDDGRMRVQLIIDDGDECEAVGNLCRWARLEGALVSMDALHCIEETATAVRMCLSRISRVSSECTMTPSIVPRVRRAASKASTMTSTRLRGAPDQSAPCHLCASGCAASRSDLERLAEPETAL